MTARYTRVLLVAIAISTLLIPAVGTLASPKEEKLEDVESDLDAIRDQINLHEEQAETKKELVDSLNDDLIDLQVAINDLDKKIADVEGDVRDAQSRVDATKKEIAGVRSRAIAQAVELYKGGSTQELAALMNAQTLGELNDRVEMMGIAAEENSGALVKYGRLKTELEAEYADLFALKKDLDAKLADRTDYMAELETQKKKVLTQVAALNEKLDAEHNLEDHKQEEYDDIKSEILAAAAANGGVLPSGVSVATGAPSASGFIWPINGGVTSPFGWRWGRMHEGIDIDGYTGQPIAASKAGTVISAGDAGDGYGTKVVIDHGGGYTTLYGHMSRLGTSNGASVSQGQVIGFVGCTGSCTGDHLHFEIRVNGAPQNPLNYLP